MDNKIGYEKVIQSDLHTSKKFCEFSNTVYLIKIIGLFSLKITVKLLTSPFIDLPNFALLNNLLIFLLFYFLLLKFILLIIV